MTHREGTDHHRLVGAGEAMAVIVLPDEPGPLQREAVTDFVQTIEVATGVCLPVCLAREAPPPSAQLTRILIGPSQLTRELGVEEVLEPETFRLRSVDHDLVVLAQDILHEGRIWNIWKDRDSEDSRVTQWALGYLLDRYVEVRWLWPGELGTHIPRHESLVIPRLDVRFQQPLRRRCFHVVESNPDNLRWLTYHHFGGKRVDYYFNHSFRAGQDNGNWWADFYATRPDLLAKSPDGTPGTPPQPGFFKLCISNPDVTQEILRRWEADGQPDFRDITPNDGNGFCTCDGCRALDREFGDVDYTPEEIWRRPDHVVLTDRYVWFWNQLILKMRAKNPRAKIGVYLYSAYRNPPKKLRVEAGIVGEMVHGFDFSHWIAWQQAGVEEIGLRPNWLYMGACGPHLPLSVAGHYIEQARSHQMSIISMDCLHEYWATQGPYYYLIARLVSRPDLTTREIRAEYCDAFGDAADVIAEYLDFWEAYHRQVGYNVPAGGSVGIDPDGLYARVSQEHFGQIMHPLRGHWKTLSHIYMPQIMREAGQILDRASSLTADTLTRGRIDFLRDGLRMVELAAHYMTAQEAADDAGMRTDLGHLKRFGDNMREKHGYWHSKDIFFLMWWGLIGDEYAVSPGQ